MSGARQTTGTVFWRIEMRRFLAVPACQKGKVRTFRTFSIIVARRPIPLILAMRGYRNAH